MEFFSAILVTTLVFAALTLVSLFSPFGGVLAPLPMLYFYSKLGRGKGWMVFLLSIAGAVFFTRLLGIAIPFFYFFLYGLLGPVLSEVLRKNYSIEKSIALSVGAMLLAGLFILFYYSLTMGQAPWEIVAASISRTVQEKISLYAQLGIPAEQLDIIREHTGEITRILLSIAPSFALVGSIFLVWINIIVGKWLFVRMGMWYPEFGDLSIWKVPERTVWLFIGAGIFILLPLAVVRVIGLNTLIVLIFFYMLQGLSIINFFFSRKNVPQIFRVVGYGLIFAQQLLLLVVAALGLLDVWIDFRKVNKAV